MGLPEIRETQLDLKNKTATVQFIKITASVNGISATPSLASVHITSNEQYLKLPETKE